MNTYPATAWPDIDHPRTPRGWSWPANLLTPAAPVWPRGRQVVSPAEAILSDAVAWWDASRSGFREGDRRLRNLGVAGSVLDLYSGGSKVATTTNDPLFLPADNAGYIYLPGVNNNGATITDTTSSVFDFAGDIDVRVLMSCASWTGTYQLCNKENASVCFELFHTNGQPYIQWYDTIVGAYSGELGAGSTYWSALSVNVPVWLRFTLDADRGDGKYEIKWWHSYDNSSWTQDGATKVGTTVATRIINNDPVGIGAAYAASTQTGAMKIYRAQIYNGIAGTLVMDADFSNLTNGSATTMTESANSLTVNLSRSSSGRKLVAVPSRHVANRNRFLLGTDDYFEVPAERGEQKAQLNFPLDQSFTVMVAYREWATQASNGRYISTWANGTKPGWIVSNSGGSPAFTVTDGTLSPATTGSAVSAGTMRVFTGQRDRATRLLRSYTNSTANATAADTVTVGLIDPASNAPVRIGVNPNAVSNNADIEFYAAAVWRRLLTAREIAVLASTAQPAWGA